MEQVQFGSVEPTDQLSVEEEFDKSLKISQDEEETQLEASEKTEDGQQDGQMVASNAAKSSSTDTKWAVGAACLAVWSEDGQEYKATVVSVDGERCRVRFDHYGNEEDMEVSVLRSRHDTMPMEKPPIQDWKPGSACRAVYSKDGRVYPAVVVWVKGQRCRVRFDGYNNEEEQDTQNLLSPHELRGPFRTAAKRFKERDHQSRPDKEAEEKKRGGEKPANHSFPPFPPFPPQNPMFHLCPPPPPPAWTEGFADANTTSSRWMLWFMYGFHTGCYMAQQFSSTSKD